MQVKLQHVKLVSPELFEAKRCDEEDNAKFSATFLIPKDHPSHREIEAAILQVARNKWGEQAASILATIRDNPLRFCYHHSKENNAGHMSFRASNKARPLVLDRDLTPLTVADDRPYDGCYVNATLTLFAYQHTGKGICASLGGVQFSHHSNAYSRSNPPSVNTSTIWKLTP